jgi:hypothetical protein
LALHFVRAFFPRSAKGRIGISFDSCDSHWDEAASSSAKEKGGKGEEEACQRKIHCDFLDKRTVFFTFVSEQNSFFAFKV